MTKLLKLCILFAGALSFGFSLPAYAFTSNTNSTTLAGASTQYWSVADNTALSFTSNYSISLWVKFTTLPSNFAAGSNMDFVAKWQSTTNNESYRMWVGSTNLMNLDYSGDGINANVTRFAQSGTATFTSTAVWYHVCGTATVATKSLAIYINGSAVTGANSNTGSTAVFDSTASLAVGAVNVNGTAVEPSDAQFDEVLIYNADIGSSGCSALFTNPCNPSTTNLVAEYRFDNNGNDSFGTNNLTGTNAPTFTATTAFTCAAAAGSVVPTPRMIPLL